MKAYNIVKVGGDPTEIAFLAENLSRIVGELQLSGWTIERIDPVDNTRAWDCKKQMYVSTTEYIIIAYRNTCEADEAESEEE